MTSVVDMTVVLTALTLVLLTAAVVAQGRLQGTMDGLGKLSWTYALAHHWLGGGVIIAP